MPGFAGAREEKGEACKRPSACPAAIRRPCLLHGELPRTVPPALQAPPASGQVHLYADSRLGVRAKKGKETEIMPDDRLGMKGEASWKKVLTYRPRVTLRWLDGRLVARRGFDELQRLIREHVPVCYKYSAHELVKNSLTST